MTRIREVTENDDFSYFVSTKLPSCPSFVLTQIQKLRGCFHIKWCACLKTEIDEVI